MSAVVGAALASALRVSHHSNDERCEGSQSAAIFRRNLKDVIELPCCHKLATARDEEVTLQDVQELCEGLGPDDQGRIRLSRLQVVLEEAMGITQREAALVCSYVGEPSELRTAQELHDVIKAGLMGMYLQRLLDQRLKRQVTGLDGPSLISRTFFAESVKSMVEREDAFLTLPYTLVYLVIFMSLIILHLRIWQRQVVEEGLEEWMRHPPLLLDGPFLDMHVTNTNSFFAWLDMGALGAIFGHSSKFGASLNRSLDHQPMLATTNALVGDALLTVTNFDGSQLSAWLLDSAEGAEHLAKTGNDYLGAARAAAGAVGRSGFAADGATTSLQLQFATFNEEVELFSLSQVGLNLDAFGHVQTHSSSSSVLMTAVPHWSTYVLDVLFIAFTLRTAYVEGKDLVASARLGYKEVMDYFGLWNIIDWLNILLALSNCVFFSICVLQMQAASLSEVLQGEDGSYQLVPDIMSFTSGQLLKLHEDLQNIRSYFLAVHVMVAINTVCLVGKLFKGFQANARLALVTETLKMSAEDVFHFFIVFLAVSVSFAVIAHVLFGGDVLVFYTFASSMNACLFLLFGDFDWYVTRGSRVTGDLLKSGIPWALLQIWLLMYIFFVMLVMLNMLLAIILEKYSKVTRAVTGTRHAQSLLTQAVHFAQRVRETRHFKSLHGINRLLWNDLNPAHPGPEVSSESLLEAFPSMKVEQADWLMRWILSEREGSNGDMKESREAIRAKRTEVLVETIASSVQGLSTEINEATKRLDRIHGGLK